MARQLKSGDSRLIVIDAIPLTGMAAALATRLVELNLPIISDYQISLELWRVYKHREAKYLRGRFPARTQFDRCRGMLAHKSIISRDGDYGTLWRVTALPDQSADELTCVADQSCYISHLSAMQRYGLTNRRPEALFITQAAPRIAKKLNQERIEQDYGDDAKNDSLYIAPLRAIHHPKEVRGRAVEVLSTSHPGTWRNIRGTSARISTIGQVFLETLSHPSRCGGMLHVLNVWSEHASTFLEEIVKSVNLSDRSILKVRAGYILEECLGISDARIDAWKSHAQRGGSRVLDPHQPFVEKHSETWMLSINAG